MSETAHLEKLIQLHRELDLKIKDGYTHYLDDAHLKKMKQEKLFLKRSIEKLQNKGLSEKTEDTTGFN